MQDCSICYVTDKGFLLPSLVSAARLRTFVPAHRADILLFVTETDNLEINRLRNLAQKYSITVIPMEEKHFSGFAQGEVHKSHVSLTTLGRFFINDALPQSCGKILYIDGDTWAFKDPSRLVEWSVPDGKLAGVEDTIVFDRHVDESLKSMSENYFKGLGLPDNAAYMNAGIFMTTKAAWKTIASEAFEYFKSHTAACRHHDQSAMNAVLGDRRIHLSCSWNFQTAYKLWGVESVAEPRIGHFTGNGKPWSGRILPWADCYDVFCREAENFSALGLTFARKSPLRRCYMNTRQTIKKYSLMCRAEPRRKLLAAIKAELERCVQVA
ncbi:MAG: glycosyltransferase [Bdellovibrionales bacterium]